MANVDFISDNGSVTGPASNSTLLLVETITKPAHVRLLRTSKRPCQCSIL